MDATVERIVQQTAVLGESRQKQLNQDKIQTRIENERYLRKHPEIEQIVGYFTCQVLLNRPSNVAEFAVGILADPALKIRVDAYMAEKSRNTASNTNVDA